MSVIIESIFGVKAELGGGISASPNFGDFDPSGIDIERDLSDRLTKYNAGDFEVLRVALTSDQIKRYQLPPMPVKRSDARADGFLAEHGDRAVELDALDPNLLQRTVAESIEIRINKNAWNKKLRKIEELRTWIKMKLDDIEKLIEIV